MAKVIGDNYRPTLTLGVTRCMQRITNKTKKSLSRDSFAKHPGRFLKRDTSGRLRQREKESIATDDISVIRTTSPEDKHGLRKQPGRCPLCLSRLKKNKKGTRYLRTCKQCRAQLKPELRCPSCSTNRVWSRPGEVRCKGCGYEVMRNEALQLDGEIACLSKLRLRE